ncbi:MAG: hypothetical protein FWG02_11765 [Holophagaceae bacterium]|nr:hypothetical protein [Holophagaceae bacterium]
MKKLLCATVFASLALLVSCGQGMPGGNGSRWVLIENGVGEYGDKKGTAIISMQIITSANFDERSRWVDKLKNHPITIQGISFGPINITKEKAIEIFGKDMVEKLLAE